MIARLLITAFNYTVLKPHRTSCIARQQTQNARRRATPSRSGGHVLLASGHSKLQTVFARRRRF